jgi:hypothetical protein
MKLTVENGVITAVGTGDLVVPINRPHYPFPDGWTVTGSAPSRHLVAPDGSLRAVEWVEASAEAPHPQPFVITPYEITPADPTFTWYTTHFTVEIPVLIAGTLLVSHFARPGDDFDAGGALTFVRLWDSDAFNDQILDEIDVSPVAIDDPGFFVTDMQSYYTGTAQLRTLLRGDRAPLLDVTLTESSEMPPSTGSIFYYLWTTQIAL